MGRSGEASHFEATRVSECDARRWAEAALSLAWAFAVEDRRQGRGVIGGRPVMSGVMMRRSRSGSTVEWWAMQPN